MLLRDRSHVNRHSTAHLQNGILTYQTTYLHITFIFFNIVL